MNTLSKKTRLDMREVSNALDIPEEAVLERAVSFFSNAVRSEIDLKKEFDFWDRLSDEAWLSTRL